MFRDLERPQVAGALLDRAVREQVRAHVSCTSTADARDAVATHRTTSVPISGRDHRSGVSGRPSGRTARSGICPPCGPNRNLEDLLSHRTPSSLEPGSMRSPA